MKVAGFDVIDVVGNGVQGTIPLSRLTLLFGKNAAGKTTFLETLVSLLDPKVDWKGRRARIDDESYAYGRLFLSGSWDGSDWHWLRGVMGHRSDDDGLASEYLLPMSAQNLESRTAFVRSAAAWFIGTATPGSTQVLEKVLDLLTAHMLVTYSPWPYQIVSAVVDTSSMRDNVRSFLRDASIVISDSMLTPRLRQIAESASGFIELMDLGVLDEENFEQHALHPPSVIHISADPLDAEAVLEAALFTFRVTQKVQEPGALSPTGDGRYRTHPAITGATAELHQMLSSGPSPAFVLEQGLPEITIPSPELWSFYGRVLLGLRTPANTLIDLKQTSAGVTRWIQILVVLAVDDWIQEGLAEEEAVNWVGGAPIVTRAERQLEGRILVLDEPELHLHPVAQAQITDWLVHSQGSATTILTATHSPPILAAHGDNVRLVGVRREGRNTTLQDLTADALTALDEAAGAFGADRATWLQIARGLVLVEGNHDVVVIQHFYGMTLKALRAAVIPIRGHKALTGTVISEFFARMGIPVRVLLDDVRHAATLGDDSVQLASSEERVVHQLTRQREKFPHVDVIAYPEPDIICSLPMAAVRRAWPNAKHLTWSEIIDSWRSRSDRPGFKSYALKRLGIDDSADGFLERTLNWTLPDEAPSVELDASMQALIASLR